MRGLGSFLSPKERHLIFSYQWLIGLKKRVPKRTHLNLQLDEISDNVLAKSILFHAYIIA